MFLLRFILLYFDSQVSSDECNNFKNLHQKWTGIYIYIYIYIYIWRGSNVTLDLFHWGSEPAQTEKQEVKIILI